jgi:hypothetical protein
VAKPKSIFPDSVMSRISRKVIVSRGSRTAFKRLKDSTVSHSSTEAELTALDEVIRQAVWLRNFLAELIYHQSKPTVIYVDSKSSISISESLKTGSNQAHDDEINYF